MSEIVIPAQADRLKRLADSQSGHASMFYHRSLREPVLGGTNIVVAAFTIDDLANLATVLTAMKSVAGVGTGKVVASGQVPAEAPVGVNGEGRWELSVDAGLRGYTAEAPVPE